MELASKRRGVECKVETRRFMKILIAPDKFKGSLSAAAAARRIADGLGPGFECRLHPIADGGEGTSEAIRLSLGGERIPVRTEDALGRVVEGSFVRACRGGEWFAAVDLSEASGLWRLAERERDPWRASTHGTGLLLRAAAEAGADRIVLGLGGSATNDGGSGLARALGYRFLDASGTEVTRIPEDLGRAERIAGTRIALPRIVAACDVTNRLLGERGATRVYGPQKGIGPADWARQEERLRRLADLVERDLGFRGRDLPGSGAAGGAGFGAMAFAGAEMESGFSLVAEVTGLAEAMAGADLVVTGEGSLDFQTLHGKGPHGVASLARSLGKPVVAFAGRVEAAAEADLAAVFDRVWRIAPEGTEAAESMLRAGEFLENAAREAATALRRGIPG
jgi:glycerate kinase